MVSKNPQKIGEANGMHILPTVPTQVTKTRNVGSVYVFRMAHLFTFGPREANGMPILPTAPTQLTKTKNVGSVDVFGAAHIFTFGPRGQGNALRGS